MGLVLCSRGLTLPIEKFEAWLPLECNLWALGILSLFTWVLERHQGVLANSVIYHGGAWDRQYWLDFLERLQTQVSPVGSQPCLCDRLPAKVLDTRARVRFLVGSTPVHAGSVAKSRLTLCVPMDCSPPGSSVYGVLQTRVLEWVAISFSRRYSQLRDQLASPGSPALQVEFFLLGHQGSAILQCVVVYCCWESYVCPQLHWEKKTYAWTSPGLQSCVLLPVPGFIC